MHSPRVRLRGFRGISSSKSISSLPQRCGPVEYHRYRHYRRLVGNQKAAVIADVEPRWFDQTRLKEGLRRAERKLTPSVFTSDAIIVRLPSTKNSFFPSRLQVGKSPPFVDTCHLCPPGAGNGGDRSEEHTSELQSPC